MYSIYSYLQSFTDSGLMMTYAGTAEKNIAEVMRDIKDEIDRIGNEGLPQVDIDLFKRQIIGSLVMGADDIENRMNSIAVNDMVFNEYRQVEAVVSEIEAVSRESVRSYIQDYFDYSKLGVLVMGDVEENATLKLISSIFVD